MVKKHYLKLEYESPFRVMGVFCPQKDYRFCWNLNQSLETDLKRLPDFSYTPHNLEQKDLFSVYHYAKPQLRLAYYLISNKGQNGRLFAEPKNLDFILLLKNPGGHLDPDALIRKIRNTSMVQAAFFLDDKLGKRANTFFYDFEMYLSETPKS